MTTKKASDESIDEILLFGYESQDFVNDLIGEERFSATKAKLNDLIIRERSRGGVAELEKLAHLKMPKGASRQELEELVKNHIKSRLKLNWEWRNEKA